MRQLLCFAVSIFLVGSVRAEKLVFVPTAVRPQLGTLRLDFLAEGASINNRNLSLIGSFGNMYEFGFTYEKLRGKDRGDASLDFAINLVPAIPDYGFGFTLGVVDTVGNTVRGRGFYGAATLRFNNDQDINGMTPTDVTIGAGTGRFDGFFLAFRYPFTNDVRLIAEHDSHQLMGGMEIQISRDQLLRWTVRDRETFLGFSAKVAF